MFVKIYKLDSLYIYGKARNEETINCPLIFNPTMDCNARYYNGGTWITSLRGIHLY